jgi:hypothetical protein
MLFSGCKYGKKVGKVRKVSKVGKAGTLGWKRSVFAGVLRNIRQHFATPGNSAQQCAMALGLNN